MSVIIGHASINEYGSASGGVSGDQNGREVCTRSWYDKQWSAVIRPISSFDADRIATAMEQACENDYIGYDQTRRTTLYYRAKENNWDISKIKTPCECDCSSGVAVCVNAAGISISKDCTTSNLVSACSSTGRFQILREAKYTRVSDNLLRGDILVKEGSHAAIVLSSNYSGSADDYSGGTETSGGTATLMSDPVVYTSYTASITDTLSSIASRFGTTVSMIMYLNPDISESTNLSGKTLKLSVSKSESTGSISSSQAITKKSSTGVTVSRPYAKVQIYTESGMLSVRQNLLVRESNMDSDILSITTNRDMQQDCPTFTISLTFRRDWYDKVGSNDLIIIEMTRPPENEKPVFFGLVDDVRKSTDYNSGKPMRTISITGRGFGKAFARFEIGTLSELNALSNSFGFMTPALLESVSAQPPAEVAKLLMESYIGNGCNYKFSNGKTYLDYFNYLFSSGTMNDKLTDTNSFLSFSGSLWNLLKEVKDSPFNEMFWEIIDKRPTLIFRPTPFNEKDWTKLYRVTVKDFDLISEDLGVSDVETSVVFKVESETFLGDSESIVLPLWYPPYYTKYGLSRLSVSSKYLYGDSIEEVHNKTKDLFNWNILNNSMENGSITVKGSNVYQVGSRIILESTGVEYYVEAVNHNFTFFQGWTTTLSLTRGIVPSKRFNAPWGLSQQLTMEDAVSIIGYSENASHGNYSVSGYDGGGMSGVVTNGTTINIPSGLGSVHTYMGWQMITSTTSTQYKLRNQAGMNFDSEGFGKINGRYVIACTNTFGKVGDYVDFYQTDGLVLKCIIGDIKNQNDAGANKWGHQNGTCIIEFVVNKTTWYSKSNGGSASKMHANPGNASCHPEWNKNLTKCVNGGSYFDNPSGIPLSNQVEKYTTEDYNYLVGIISAEAPNDEKDMAGIAWCMLNRRINYNFPNTIKEVVTKAGYFTLNWSAYVGMPINSSVNKVAKGVLEGTIPNPIGNRVHFKSQAYYNSHKSECPNPITVSENGHVYHD